jgi:hypothetical protein
MGGIDFFMAPVSLEKHMIYAMLVCPGLEFTVVVGDADSADMCAFSEQCLEHHLSVFIETRRLRSYLHA